MQKVKTITRVVAALLLAAVVLVSILIAVAKTPWFDGMLAARLTAMAGEAGITVKVEEFDFDPIGPSIRAKAVNVSDNGGAWSVASGTVYARIHFIASVFDTPTVTLTVQSPSIQGVFSGAGAPVDEEEQAPTPEGPGLLELASKVNFRKIKVTDGNFNFRVTSQDLSVRLDELALAWSGSRGSVTSGGGAITWKGRTEELKTLRVEGLDAQSSDVATFELETTRIKFNVDGAVSRFNNLAGTCSLELDFTDLPDEWVKGLGLGWFAPVSARIAYEGELSGAVDDPVLTGVLKAGRGRFGGIVLEKVQGNVGIGSGQLSFSGLDVRSNAGRIKDVEGTIKIGDGLMLDATATAQGFSLREAMSPLGGGYFPVGLHADGKAYARGELYPELGLDVGVRGMKVSRFEVSTPYDGDEPVTWYGLDSATVAADARIQLDGIDFGKADVDAGSLKVKVQKGRLDYREGMSFDTVVDIRDLSSVARYLPEGFDCAGKLQGVFGGPYRNLRFDYSLDLDSSSVFGQQLGSVKGKASYDLRTLTLNRVRVTGPKGDISIDGTAELVPGGAYDMDIELNAGELGRVAGMLEAITGMPSPVGVSGSYEAKGKIGGVLMSPYFEGDVRATGVTVTGIRGVEALEIDLIEASAKAGLGIKNYVSVNAEAYGAFVDGILTADTELFMFEGNLTGFDLTEVDRIVEQPVSLAGVFSGPFKVGGPFSDPAVTLYGKVDDFWIESADVGVIEVNAHVDSSGVGVSGARPDGKLGFKGSWLAKGDYELEVSLDALEWSALPEKFLPSGIGADTVTGSGKAYGVLLPASKATLEDARWEGQLAEAFFKDVELGEADVTLHYPGEVAGTLQVTAQLWEDELEVSTMITPANPTKPVFGVNASGLRLERLKSMLPGIKSGTVDMEAVVSQGGEDADAADDLKGLIRSIDMLEASGRFWSVTLDGVSRFGVGSFSLIAHEGRWELEGKADEFTSITGHMSDEFFEWAVTADFDGLDPSDYVSAGSDYYQLTVSGQAVVWGRAYELYGYDGEGTFSDAVAYDIGPHEGTWFASSESPLTQADFSVTVNKNVSVFGIYERDNGGLDVRIEANDAEIGDWVPETVKLGGAEGRFTGFSNVEISNEGKLQAEVTFNELIFDAAPVRVSNLGDLEFSIEDGEVFLESVGLAGDGFNMGLLGSFVPGKSVNLRLSLDAKLEQIYKLIPGIESARGTAEAEVSLSGDWDEPVAKGSFSLNEGAMVNVTGIEYPFENLTFYAVLEEKDEIKITSVDATFGEGALHAEGRWTLQGFIPSELDLFIEAKNIFYEYPRGASYGFDGNFLLTGPLDALQVRGEVRLAQFLFTRQIKWRTSALKLLERSRSAKVALGQKKGVYVDIAVTGRNDLKVATNIADLDLEVDMRVSGYLPDPDLWGRVDIIEGKIRFRGREFTVLRSNAEFLGDLGPVAVLDGRAVTQVGEYTVNVAVSGPLDDVTIELSSVPALSRTDIVALLALGTTSENIEGGGAVSAFEATSFITGGLQDELEGGASALGFDQFNVNPAYSESQDTTVTRITIGKALSDSLFAKYGADLGSGSEQEVSLEYTLSPGVLLLGSWADEGRESSGSFGGEIRFRYTFR